MRSNIMLHEKPRLSVIINKPLQRNTFVKIETSSISAKFLMLLPEQKELIQKLINEFLRVAS